jgi:hypothetical protein
MIIKIKNMINFKIPIIIIFLLLSSCAYYNIDQVERSQLSCDDLASLYNNRVTKHLRFSLDDYDKYARGEKFKFPKTKNAFRPDQLALLKDKFLMLRIAEVPYISYDPKREIILYKKQSANQYTYANLTILISPKEMQVWKLELYPIGSIGYDIIKVEEILLSKKKKAELEACKSPENMQYWI